MGDVVKLETNRALHWTVEEALEHALASVKNGSLQADRVYIALCKKPEKRGDHAALSYVMAGMEVPEALGWLHLHMDFLSSDSD